MHEFEFSFEALLINSGSAAIEGFTSLIGQTSRSVGMTILNKLPFPISEYTLIL